MKTNKTKQKKKNGKKNISFTHTSGFGIRNTCATRDARGKGSGE